MVYLRRLRRCIIFLQPVQLEPSAFLVFRLRPLPTIKSVVVRESALSIVGWYVRTDRHSNPFSGARRSDRAPVQGCQWR